MNKERGHAVKKRERERERGEEHMGGSINAIIGAELRRRESVSAGVKHNSSIKKGQILKDKAGDVTASTSRIYKCLVIPRASFNSSACFGLFLSSPLEINPNFPDAIFLKVVNYQPRTSACTRDPREQQIDIAPPFLEDY